MGEGSAEGEGWVGGWVGEGAAQGEGEAERWMKEKHKGSYVCGCCVLYVVCCMLYVMGEPFWVTHTGHI